MTNELLPEYIIAKFPEIIAEQGGQWPTLQIPAAEWKSLAYFLRDDASLAFDYLFCLTCVDWPDRLGMVYHLTSTVHRHTIVIKASLPRTEPVIESVSFIWRTAEFHEREVFELFGVYFKNHPDMRKLILPDDWEGFPLRKDYEDPINMIKL